MKFFMFAIASLFAFSAFADTFDSRTRYVCTIEENSKFELELAIHDSIEEDASVILVNTKNNVAIRTAPAFFQDQEFLFGQDLSENVWLDYNEETGLTGYVNMVEVSGSLSCQEVSY